MTFLGVTSAIPCDTQFTPLCKIIHTDKTILSIVVKYVIIQIRKYIAILIKLRYPYDILYD